jgi:hypothetical protein
VPQVAPPVEKVKGFMDTARTSLMVALVACLTGPASAQTGAIRGTIVETRDGTPVARVSVRLQSSGRTVITDEQGRFAFDEVPAGEQELYVSAVDFILVKRTVTVGTGLPVEITIALTEGTGTYTETVNVRGGAGIAPRREPGVPSEQTLGSRELQQLRGLVTNDPFRAVQVLPAVAAGDDLRSEFAIRGAGVRQMNFTFEGISTPFLLHTVQQVHDSGSVAMVNGDVLEEISVRNGSHPQRHGNRTGAEIEFRMREGSRERLQSHLSVSAIDASGVVEGPIGAGKRGSWMFTARQSYLNLVLDRIYPDQNISFGFVDAQSKVVYDLTPRHQLQFAFTGGRSRMERPPDQLGAGNLRDADNQAAVAVATWRYLPSARFTIAERVAIAQNTFENSSRDGAELNGGDGRDTLARTDLSYAPAGWVTIDGGGEARWSTGAGREQRLASGRFQTRDDYRASSTTTSAFVQTRFGPSGGPSVTPGVRLDRQSVTDRVDVSPWLQAMWPLERTSRTSRTSKTSRALTLRGGGGIYRQQPGFAERFSVRGSRDLRPERAYHADVGVEGQLGSHMRWQMTVYDREDRDLLRLPDSEVHVVNGALVFGSATSKWINALDGHARGVEWLVQRQHVNGFSGWLSYALSFAEYRDRRTGESFWGDYDQRHTINLYGTYRVTDRLSAGARFRGGSNFPITGYWRQQGDAYFVGTDRNALRVPMYARLDVRANRTFTWDRKRLTLFVEGINVLNRPNVRFALPSVNRRTFEASELLDTMVPLIPSVGILLEF